MSHAYPGQLPLFVGISTQFAAGVVTAVVGPSGSGKSTLLAIAAGWIVPNEGRVVRPAGSTLTWVFQNPHGVARRSALDHVTLPLLARGSRRRDADEEGRGLLQRFGLGGKESRRFGELSGGEAQRLMLARAVAVDSTVILVDEPTAQLDPSSADSVVATLGGLAARGRVVAIATHDPRVRSACTAVIDLAEWHRARH